MNNVAWVVSFEDPEGSRGCVVFAQEGDASTALLLGHSRLGNDDPSDLEASRQPEFDQYAEAGKVPASVLVANGWQFECCQCGSLFQEDDDIVEDGKLVFCSEVCRINFASRVRSVNQDFESFKERVRSRFPNLTFGEFHGGWPILTPIAHFTFPGSLYGGGRIRQAQDGTLQVSVAQGDLPAWERYRAEAGS